MAEPHEQPCHLERVLGVVDVVGLVLTEASEVDDGAGDAALEQELAEAYQVRLDAALRGRIRPELDHSHRRAHSRTASKSIGRGASARADSSIRRQPTVARAPSRTVTAGGVPVLIPSSERH